MPQQIAIVEDDPQQRTQYAEALRQRGYRVVEHADTRGAIDAFEVELPQLAILDVMLGTEVGGGFEICRYLQQRDPALPVIFLTSRGDELDRIYGLQLGAWDYQTKPVSLAFLVARVESLFRITAARLGEGGVRDVLRSGELELDRRTLGASWRGQPLSLTPTEFDILLRLLQHPEGASYDQLADATRQGVVENNTINTHINHLRRKFQSLDSGFQSIQTRYGFGYRWVAA